MKLGVNEGVGVRAPITLNLKPVTVHGGVYKSICIKTVCAGHCYYLLVTFYVRLGLY